MRTKIFIGLVTALILLTGTAHAQDPAIAAMSFGYALQAQGWCDDLIVNMQTEKRLEKLYGQKMRGPESSLNGKFMEGTQRYMVEHSEVGAETACKRAWDRVGPSGKEYPGLLMKSPFK